MQTTNHYEAFVVVFVHRRAIQGGLSTTTAAYPQPFTPRWNDDEMEGYVVRLAGAFTYGLGVLVCWNATTFVA